MVKTGRQTTSFQRRDVGDGALQFKQEGIQIDGDELGGTNARQTTSITQPTGRVIPTGGLPIAVRHRHQRLSDLNCRW